MDFLDMMDMSSDQLRSLLDVSHVLKRMYREDQLVGHRPFVGKSMAMIFAKRSTRTRVSTENGFQMLGGHAVFLGSTDIHLGKEESAGDTARVLSRMNNLILARVYGHADIKEMAEASSVPVINALSDMHHPLQALADYMILQETFRHDLTGLNISWVGDGNNVCHSLAILGVNLGAHIRIATPKGYEPDGEVVAHCQKISQQTGGSILLTNDPIVAVRDTNVIATDTWVSMGDEAEADRRLADFRHYQVTEKLGAAARPDWKFIVGFLFVRC